MLSTYTQEFEHLKKSIEIINTPLPEFDETQGIGTIEFAEQQTCPFTMWETQYVYNEDNVLTRVDVKPISVKLFDLSPGASVKSILFVHSNNQRARGSVSMFYCEEKYAHAEAQYHMAATRREIELEKLKGKLMEDLPRILDAVSDLSHKTETMFQALELISSGEPASPQAVAAKTLAALGAWRNSDH